MVLPIKFWFELEYCVPIISFDGSISHSKRLLQPSALFCRSIIIYMTNYVSRILNILYRHLKIMILQITILTQLYVKVCNLLKCEKHWHDLITALKGEVSTHKINLMPMCFRGIDFFSILTTFQ